MIDRIDIENKDFSIVLPMIIHRLSALSMAMTAAAEENFHYNDEEVVGFGLIVRDIYDDLHVISEALYPSGGQVSKKEGNQA